MPLFVNRTIKHYIRVIVANFYNTFYCPEQSFRQWQKLSKQKTNPPTKKRDPIKVKKGQV